MIKTEIKKEFEGIVASMLKGKGLDDISSNLFSILYTATEKMTLEELSNKTKYSMSAVCTAMKLLEGTGLVERTKSPGSKKIYYHMEKNLLKKILEIQKRQNEHAITPALIKLPDIIKEIQKDKNTTKEELTLIKEFYEQMKTIQEINKMIEKKINDINLKKS